MTRKRKNEKKEPTVTWTGVGLLILFMVTTYGTLRPILRRGVDNAAAEIPEGAAVPDAPFLAGVALRGWLVTNAPTIGLVILVLAGFVALALFISRRLMVQAIPVDVSTWTKVH